MKLLADFMKKVDTDIIGKPFGAGKGNGVDNRALIDANEVIRFHPIEIIGYELRESMSAMKDCIIYDTLNNKKALL